MEFYGTGSEMQKASSVQIYWRQSTFVAVQSCLLQNILWAPKMYTQIASLSAMLAAASEMPEKAFLCIWKSAEWGKLVIYALYGILWLQLSPGTVESLGCCRSAHTCLMCDLWAHETEFNQIMTFHGKPKESKHHWVDDVAKVWFFCVTGFRFIFLRHKRNKNWICGCFWNEGNV